MKALGRNRFHAPEKVEELLPRWNCERDRRRLTLLLVGDKGPKEKKCEVPARERKRRGGKRKESGAQRIIYRFFGDVTSTVNHAHSLHEEAGHASGQSPPPS